MRFNPYDPAFAADPYVQYARLRETDPVHKSFMGTWVLTRYADVARVLRDPNFSSDLRNWDGFGRRYRNRESVAWLLNRSVLNVDPPFHTQLRKALTSAFGPSQRTRLAGTLAEIARRQVAEVKAHGLEFDAIEQFALPVPVRAIAHLYQVSTQDLPVVKRWSVDVSGLIEPLPTGHALEDAERSIAEFKAYLKTRLQPPGAPEDAGAPEGSARHEPARSGSCPHVGADAIGARETSGAYEASDGGDCLPGRLAEVLQAGEIDEDHVLANLILMFPAGHETTINLIGNGLHALLQHPEQQQRLREEPALITHAVEEILRYEPPQQVAWRSVLDDCEIGGRTLRKGDQVMMVLGAANRDPDAFDDPDRFDITRERNPHLSFGLGRHACLGSWFARLQGAIALSTFLDACPTMRLRDRAQWYTTMSFHGLKSLPVRVG